jgi:hypothetical protein
VPPNVGVPVLQLLLRMLTFEAVGAGQLALIWRVISDPPPVEKPVVVSFAKTKANVFEEPGATEAGVTVMVPSPSLAAVTKLAVPNIKMRTDMAIAPTREMRERLVLPNIELDSFNVPAALSDLPGMPRIV